MQPKHRPLNRDRCRRSLRAQEPLPLTLPFLRRDEVLDVGMIGVQNYHLGSATCFAARLDGAGESVEPLHEAERA